MILIEKEKTYGWEAAVRGMRNPMNSWDKSDSDFEMDIPDELGERDLDLMKKLVASGDSHAKVMRYLIVTMDITAPLYWWKEFDTYKVATVSDSCSTMHKIMAKEFEMDDFSHDHLYVLAKDMLSSVIDMLNGYRNVYLRNPFDPENPYAQKNLWYQVIQLLPSSYNQKRTIQLNYQVLKHMYHDRKMHKLDEWRNFCTWVETLPYAQELIICDE